MTYNPKVSCAVDGRGSQCHIDDAENLFCEFIRCPERVFENPDPNRTHLNEYYINPKYNDNNTWDAERQEMPDYMSAIDTLMTERCEKSGRKKRKIGKNQVLTQNFVIQCSPERWYPAIREWSHDRIMRSTFEERIAVSEFLEEEARNWAHDVMQYLKQKYGDNLLSMQLHMDEGSPHIHAQIMPISEDGRLTARDFFGSREQFQKKINNILDELAEVSQKHGINRAEKGGEKTTDIKQFKKEQQARLKAEFEEYQKAERDTEGDLKLDVKHKKIKLPEYTIDKPLFGAEKKSVSEEEFYKYQKQVKSNIDSLTTQVRELDNARKNAIIENRVLNRIRTELEQKNKQLEDNIMKLYDQIAEQKNIIMQTELETVLQAIYGHYPDFTIEKNGPNNKMVSWGGYKIAVKNHTVYIDNHDNTIRGRGPIAAIMQIEGKNFREAIDFIAQNMDIRTAKNIILNDETYKNKFEQQLEQNATKQETRLPQENEQNIDRLKYLFVRQRNIDEKIVNHMIATKQMYVDNNNNCVVKRINNGAFIRGTAKPRDGKSWKQTLGTKAGGIAELFGPEWKPEDKSVYLAEGITSAVAFINEHPGAKVWITGGNGYPELPVKSDTKIYLAFDNDKKGDEHIKHYSEQYKDIICGIIRPETGNDWGDYVIQKKSNPKKEALQEAIKTANRIIAEQKKKKEQNEGQNITPN